MRPLSHCRASQSPLAKPFKYEKCFFFFFFPSSEKLGQSPLGPEPAESKLLAHICTWPRRTPPQPWEGVGQMPWELRGSWGRC